MMTPTPIGAASRPCTNETCVRPSWQDCARAGMTAAEAARARGRHRTAGAKAAARLGLTFAAPVPRRSARYEGLAEMVAAGMTYREMAAVFGVTINAVWNACRVRGLR